MTALNRIRRERLSYRAIRLAVGWIGILLPFVLMLGSWLFDGYALQPSVSHYYYTSMGDVFVGAICVIAFFLFFYAGPSRIDDWLANIAGVAALGLAFFPTTHGTGEDNATGTIHLICAGVFFVCLACFSLFLFPRGQRHNRQKRRRNRVYRLCGGFMFICLLHIVVFMRLGRDENSQLIFWTETIAILAFGVSWLTKGGVYFK